MAPPRPNGWRWYLQSQNRLDYNVLGDSKSKSQYWFKSCGNYAKKK